VDAIVDLEWRTLMTAIARRCAGELAAARIVELLPAASPADATRRSELVREAMASLADGEPLPVQAVDDLGELLARVARGGDARPEELSIVARVLGTARVLRSFLRTRSERFPKLAIALAPNASLDRPLERVERAIDEAIEPTGRIRDDASPELSRARHAVATARRALADKLKQLSTHFADVLREGGPVERDGRMGLPVRADAHRRVEGIVLGASATGATLYVEPPAVTEIGNRLRIAEGDVEREELRIARELTGMVREHGHGVSAAFEAAVHADELSAIALWARDAKAAAITTVDEPVIELLSMRHPLLVESGGPVVSNDIRARAGRALVVSGPNAGGKTVTLKCLGLAALMVRAGLPIPTDERSRIGWFDPVLSDVGDQQSLERSLSTFSAHVVSYRAMVDRAESAHGAGRHALVLIDEVAGSTDPEEGAALAVALLEALVDGGALVAVTTHYERLKQRAAEDTRFDNAAVGFDFERMAPTFALRLGVVGASAALAAAGRHGLPPNIVDRARELLPKETVSREQLLAELERERDRERRARADAEAERDLARALREELEAERALVRGKERKRLQDEAAELRDAIRAARHKVREVDRLLRDGVPGREVERVVDEAARVIAVGSAVDRATHDKREGTLPIEPADIKIGMKLVAERLGVVEVLEPPVRGSVRVQAGAFALRVPLAELERAPRSESKATPKRMSGVPVPATVPAEARVIRTENVTCDVRGARVDEALARVDRFIDRCLSLGEPLGFVLHGHGTGALRQAVREHLALSAHVDRSRPADIEEGGDAFTIFWVK
jgi:DNA mismatch repair protein MutS2